jgi:hypothetical protein
MMHFCPKIPIIIVEYKKDLRNGPKVIKTEKRAHATASAVVIKHFDLILIGCIHAIFIRPRSLQTDKN